MLKFNCASKLRGSIFSLAVTVLFSADAQAQQPVQPIGGTSSIPAANPNGARDNIAGICSRARNVMGLMPHPERACEDLLGSSDGRELFRSLAGTLAAAA